MDRGEFNIHDKSFDIEKCIEAAEDGNSEAQESLGVCYYLGILGVEKNGEKAFQLASKSAKQGLPEGLDLLGDCYKNGFGTDIDEKKAFECYKKAAKKDYTNAIGDLGECYLKGIGVEQDKEKGVELLEEATERDFEPAINLLADYYFDIDEDEKGVNLLKKGKRLGNPESQTLLGLCYAKGIGTTQDEHKAFKLIQEAAVKYDYGNALFWLSRFYEEGIAVAKDHETAEMYYQKALENGYIEPKSDRKTLEDYYKEEDDDDSELEFSKLDAINYKNDKEKIQPCIVFIENHCENGGGEGSGFIISPEGYVATCEHVIRDAEKLFVKITGKNKKKKVFRGTVVKANAETDTAIIKIEDAPKLPFVELDDREETEVEEDVIIYGYPLGSRLNDDVFNLNISFAKGNVSSNQVIDGIKRTMLDISAKHGNSGSPIISCKTGRVVGTLKGIVPGQEAWEEVNYMMPVCYLHELWHEIEKKKKPASKELDKTSKEPKLDQKSSKKWADVKRLLRKAYKVAEEDDKILAFNFDLENGRSQRVFVELAQTEDGEQWIKISSCVGLIDLSEINEVLKMLDGYCWGGLTVNGEKHYISHSLLLSTASETTLISPIATLAQMADEIEEKYIGGDQY